MRRQQMFPTLVAGGLVAVLATAGMGEGSVDAGRPEADPPRRFELASAVRDRFVFPELGESPSGTSTTTPLKVAPTTTTTAPPPPPEPEPEPEPEEAEVAVERVPGADIVCPVAGGVDFVDS